MPTRYQTTLLNAAGATGAGAFIQGDDRLPSFVTFQVTITGTATVTFQGNTDGSTTYQTIPVTSVAASPVTANTVTASGIYRCDISAAQIRPNVTSYSSGTVTVVASVSQGTLSGGASSGGGGGGGGAVTVADGADVALGATTDAAVTGDAAGTVNAHLRGITKQLAGTLTVSGGSGGGPATLASGAVASGAYAAGSIASGAAVSGAFADGAVTTLGTNADAAVGDATGTVNAHLRQIAKSVTGTLTVTQASGSAIKLTDGTNFAPTGDIAARSGFERITDGTNTATVKAASTPAAATDTAIVVDQRPGTTLSTTLASGAAVKVTDGTNFLPTGDAVARAIFTKNTDGTNTGAVKAASTAVVAADPALVVGISPNNVVKVGDGTTSLTMKAASTAAAAADPSAVIAISPNSPVKISDGTTTVGVDATSTGLKVAIAADLTAAPVADTTLFASAAQTTTQTSADQTNNTNRGITVIVDVTTAGTGSITLSISGKDPASGKYYALLTGAAITTISTNVYRVFPGATASANAVANDQLPHIFQIKTTANNANSMTYSVGYTLTV